MESKPIFSAIGSIRRIFVQLSRRRRTQLAGLCLLMLVGAAGELVTLGAVLPFLALMADPGKALEYPQLQDVFATLGWQDPNSILLPATIMFGVVAALSSAIRMLLIWVSNKVVFGIGYDLAVSIYSRTLFQPYSYHVANNTSQVIAGMGKAQGMVTSLLIPLINTGIAIVTAIAILAALLLIDTTIALVAGLGFTALYLLITVFTRQKLHSNSHIISVAQGARIQAIQEGLGGIRDVLIDNSQSVYIRRYEKVESALRNAQVTNTFIAASPRYLIEGLGILLIAALAYGLSQRAGGLMAAIPVLGALAIGAQKLLPLMQQVYVGWSTIMGNKGMIDDVVALVEQAIPKEYTAKGICPSLEFRETIALKGVGFQYSRDGTYVLKKLDLCIKKGSRVGFVGETGSGKSTALDLIMGLLEASDGQVLIDGRPLTAFNRRSWQSRIAHVPQTIYLADASVAENIAFGVEKSDIDYDRVRQAARQAQIAEHIESLPRQYDTSVGERGVRLSGGQRQRIGIARALYKRADVLILDEATSALDDGTESLVMQSLRGLGADLTIMMIAHRLSTLSACDCIFELHDGRLRRQGSYEQVILQQNS